MRDTRVRFGASVSGVMLAAAVLAGVRAEDWPGWRGLRADGLASADGWDPASLREGARILWKTNVGAGYSAVAVLGEYIYTMGNRDNTDTVYCLNARDGSIVWQHSYPCKAGSYPGPRATPTVVDGSVFTAGQEGQVFRLDAATGQVQWQVNIASEFNLAPPGWGYSGSVLVTGRLAVLNAGRHGLALDKNTGKKVWASPSGKCGYATPVPGRGPASKELLIFSAQAVYGVDVTDGRELWSFPWKTSYDVNAADPVLLEADVFVTSGYGTGCARIRLEGQTATAVWRNKSLAAHFGTPAVVDGFIYGVNGQAGGGGLVCLDGSTGDRRWQAPIGFGALTATRKHLIVLTEKGELVVAETTPEAYREVARARVMDRPKCWTMPVLCNGKIYCRNDQGDLVCVDGTRPK